MTRVALATIAMLSATAADARGHHMPWCGLYMSKHIFGRDIPNLRLARNWVKVGSPASGPCVGCLAVWPHHVGQVTGVDANGNPVVLSGNDGGRVRERARSLRGVIAFRVVR